MILAKFGELYFWPGMLKLEFSATTLSQLAKDNVTHDYTPISAPSREPMTCDMPNNLKWYSMYVYLRNKKLLRYTGTGNKVTQ